MGWVDFDAGCKRARISAFRCQGNLSFAPLNKSPQIPPSMAVFRV